MLRPVPACAVEHQHRVIIPHLADQIAIDRNAPPTVTFSELERTGWMPSQSPIPCGPPVVPAGTLITDSSLRVTYLNGDLEVEIDGVKQALTDRADVTTMSPEWLKVHLVPRTLYGPQLIRALVVRSLSGAAAAGVNASREGQL